MVTEQQPVHQRLFKIIAQGLLSTQQEKMTSQPITELASIIADNTKKIHDYLTAHNLPTPSFDADASSASVLPSDAPPDLEAARVAVIDATKKLRDLMLGPRDYLMSFTHNELISMQAIVRFNLISAVPTDGETSFHEIAQSRGLDELDVRRFLRHAMVKRIFQERRKGYVSHTAASRLLAEDPQLLDWVGANTDELWQAASQTINAMTKYPGSQEPNETGFALANGTNKGLFEMLSQYPERARRFGSAMKAFTEGTGFDLKHVVDGYPWESLGNGTVVDVGGSHGFVCTRLASHFPRLRFIVQDLPSVVASANIPSEFTDRVSLMQHDFLTEQPVRDADVYFFRWIFHNWSDKYCIQILRNLIPALKDGARVVVNDNVLPEPGALSSWQEERQRSMDLAMLELQNARERELDDWASLFESADSRFKFLGGKKPIGSNLWILEARWEGGHGKS